MRHLAVGIVMALSMIAGAWSSAQENADELTSRAVLIDYLNSEALVSLERRRKAISQIKTREQVEARQADVRARLLSLIGEPEHGIPLDARVTGTHDSEGFRIENVLYNAQPGRRITANLYLPANGNGPWPAIILSPGHSPNGKASNYGFAANLARNGFVALSYDIVGQGERLEYYDPASGRSLAERPTGDHSLASFPAILTGGSVARYFIEDAMQGVDYLSSRPEVDAGRIGAFGCSGGGTVTAYLAALDRRVKAAAIACYVTDFEHLLMTAGPQDAEQSVPGFIASGLDIPDWIELAAPKPYAVVSTTEDMFPFDGAKAAVQEARAFWSAFGAEEKLIWITGPGGHGAISPVGNDIVGFFRQSLGAEGPMFPFDMLNPERPEDLLVTPTGQLMTSFGTVTLADLERARAEAIRPTLPRTAASLQEAVRRHTGAAATPASQQGVTRISQETFDNLVVSELKLLSDIGPLHLRVIQAKLPDNGPVLLVVDPADMDSKPAKDRFAQLARDGWTVVRLQVRGADGEGEAKAELVGDQNILALRAMLTSHTLAGIRIDDTIAAMNWIDSEYSEAPVTVVGKGIMGPVALQAALLDPRIDAVRMEQSLVSLRFAVSVPIAVKLPANTVPGMLSSYDLPDIMAALAPRRVTVSEPIGPLGEPLSEDACRNLVPQSSHIAYTDKITIQVPR